jgi:hypothetical protein
MNYSCTPRADILRGYFEITFDISYVQFGPAVVEI